LEKESSTNAADLDFVAAGMASVDASAQVELPSFGSADHHVGRCKPCHYAHTRSGCSMGKECNRCHFRHQKRSMTNLPRQTRYKVLQLVQATRDRGSPEEHASAKEALQLFLAENPQLQNYANAVRRSLQKGAVLRGIDTFGTKVSL
jgi:hypothetical protein